MVALYHSNIKLKDKSGKEWKRVETTALVKIVEIKFPGTNKWIEYKR